MHFRICTRADCKAMSQIAYACATGDSEGFTYKLGPRFLAAYYLSVVEEPHSVVLAAIDEDTEEVVGFVAGTANAAAGMEAMRRQRLRLAWAAVLGLARNPSLLVGVLERYRATRNRREAAQYIVTTGGRAIYWGMMPAHRGGNQAIILFKKWLEIMRVLGVRQIGMEVDQANTRAQALHAHMGAAVKEAITTPEGKQRLMMEYILK